LTADTQSLAKLVRMQSQSESVANEAFQRFVLAGCHSLVHFEENGKTSVVGDPLDQAALQFSGWKYNQTADFFFRPESDAESRPASEPARLWQIRHFPFDPSRRLSSAIVLLQLKDSSLELWKLTKGSPDTMIDLIEKDSDDFGLEFRNQTQDLEMQGYRCIALGAESLGESPIAQELFPNGLSTNADSLARARANGESLHRNTIDRYVPGIVESGLKFCGFSCFDASTRPSSKRVINELVRGGLKCVMLTGDSVDAALSVARKVEIFKQQKIAVLERSENAVPGKEELVWKILHSKVRKDGSFRILHHRTKIEKATLSSVKKFIKYYEKGKYSLAANGRALELILFGQPNQLGRLIAHNLSAVSVIARATPELKKQVIETLKQQCGKRVMMCGKLLNIPLLCPLLCQYTISYNYFRAGDGVNDVAAIQSADVAASLLTGFGTEKSESGIDVDDKRRMKRLATMNIGGNRSENVGKARKQESNDRIRKEIEKYRKEIDKRASSRDSKDVELSENEFSFEDMKEIISASMRAAKNERRRAEQLRKGGGDAARILAEERQQQISTENEDDSDDFSPPSIKPGEASLVSSFSCLHPSVDGVDAILREGIATAASALATQQGIGLHSLMSCFHLATLYRDGFRYGMYMC
jgi:cation-transporting ATPase 13A1